MIYFGTYDLILKKNLPDGGYLGAVLKYLPQNHLKTGCPEKYR